MSAVMINILSFSLTLMYLFSVGPVVGQDSDPAIELSASPSKVVQPASSVSISCTLDYSQLGSTDAVWQRRVGTVVTRIAYGSHLDGSYTVEDNRYSLTQSINLNKQSFVLMISDVKYEDSGTIECVFSRSGNNRKSSLTLSVCDDGNSASCKCMQAKGWASPDCFKEPDDWVKKNEGYKNAVVALAVVLAMAIAIGILMALLAGKDCMSRALQKQKAAAERRVLAAQTNSAMMPSQPYSDRQQLTMDVNDSASDIVMPPHHDMEGGLHPQHYTTLNDMPPRQKGRRAERQSQQVMREQEDDRCSDSGMSSTNTSSVSAQVHKVDPRGQHQHQDSSASSSSSHGGARPKTMYNGNTTPPPSYKNVAKQQQESSISQQVPSKCNMYGAREDLTEAGYGATPYRSSEPPMTPRSVQSEHYSPVNHQRPPPRAVHTDIPRDKHSGDTHKRPSYTDPRKLEFSDRPHAAVNNNHEGAYIDQGSTVI